MDKTQYSSALRNAVAFLKGQKKIKKEIQISIDTGFSNGAVRYWRLAMRNAQPG